METLNNIHNRRSIRKYTVEAVSDEQIEIILRAGMMAPSAGNQQPWQFIIIRDKKKLNEISERHPYASFVKDAPLGILVCGDETLATKHKDFWVQDVSAATQNMLLAIHDLGLGGVWISSYPVESRFKMFQEVCNLPKHVIPLAFIPIGYPAQKITAVDRFKKERIHKDEW
jgi:nitroreductase